jgi:hypothetical protein
MTGRIRQNASLFMLSEANEVEGRQQVIVIEAKT